jgi:NitT/TauT family transport system substrate-binding protein
LKAGHVARSDVKVTAIGFTETEALINHQIDVAMTFIDNEPVQSEALGHPVNVLPVSNYVKLVGSGLVTSTTMANRHGKVVTAFVRATLKGLKYTLHHTDAAFKIAQKRMPELVNAQQIAIARKVLAARLAFQTPVKGKPLGWSDPKAWAATTAFLNSAGVISAPV